MKGKLLIMCGVLCSVIVSPLRAKAEEAYSDLEAADVRVIYDESASAYKIGDKLDLSGAVEMNASMARSVQYTDVYGYLEQTGSISLLPLTLNPGVYLQAQLEQPADENIDYNLYVLNEEGIIQTFSAMQTHINSTGGTLPEAVGYITPGTEAATYYLAVMSANGGSTTQPFALDISVSNEYDQYEPSENPSRAGNFSLPNGGTRLEGVTLSSPIDNDWYSFVVPEDRKYDDVWINVNTGSKNICRYEVYRNIGSDGYKMERLDFGIGEKYINASAPGTYYIRICNHKVPEDFDASDIQGYSLTVIPRVWADEITITARNGEEGLNTIRPYPDGNSYFCTRNTLNIRGYVYARDRVTGEKYRVEGAHVKIEYFNPYWELNNTPVWASCSQEVVTDSEGFFWTDLKLPPAYGAFSYDAPLTTQYYDINTFTLSVIGMEETTSRTESFVQIDYSDYHG